MPKLLNKSKPSSLDFQLEKADGFFSRAVGLLGRDRLEDRTALWITRCRSIHTFFMKFSIDVVFVDKHLTVKKVLSNVAPWKMPLPVLSASSVFEFNGGQSLLLQVEVGDQLDVVN